MTDTTAAVAARAGGELARAAALSAVIAATVLVVFWNRPINHDVAWYLIATQDWLSGAVLYVDIVEVNPPLAFYLTVPAVELGEALGIGLANAQYLVLALLLFGCLVWVSAILRGAEFGETRRNVFLIGIAGALTLPFLSATAQREHLMMFLIIPWVVGKLVLGPSGPGESARAAVAALGICIKPFFVLYPAAVTLVEVVRTRSLRPLLSTSNLTFLGVGLGYLALVALSHPLYFSDIVPVARMVYGAYGIADADILRSLYHPALMVGLVIAIVGVRGKIGRMGGEYLLALSLAALAAYLVQWTGYGYQFFPFVAFLGLSALWVAVHHRPATWQGAMALAAMIMLTVPFVRQGFHLIPETEMLVDEISARGGSERLAVLSTQLHPGPPVALQSDARWTSRYPALWLVPGAVNRLAATDCRAEREACAALNAVLDRTVGDVVSDLESARPDTLIFDTTHDYIFAPNFSWQALLSRDPRFAKIVERYGPTTTLGSFEIHRLKDD